MKKLFALIVSLGFVSEAFADDWRMRRVDLNSDGRVTFEELQLAGCERIRYGLFLAADKNKDGFLNQKEIRISSNYIVKKCPKVNPARG